MFSPSHSPSTDALGNYHFIDGRPGFDGQKETVVLRSSVASHLEQSLWSLNPCQYLYSPGITRGRLFASLEVAKINRNHHLLEQ